MEKFFKDLEAVLDKFNLDVTALDDYEVDIDFIRAIIKQHFDKVNTKIVAIENIHVFDGPHASAISSSLSVRFDVTLLPDYNIEEKQSMKLFIKVPPFEGQIETAGKLCLKEDRVYSELFRDMHNFIDHPLKGPYVAPLPGLVFTDLDHKLLVLTNVAEEGYQSPRDRFMERTELKSVLKALAKFHADGMKFLRDTSGYDKYNFIEKDNKRQEFVKELLDNYLDPYLAYLDQFTPVKPAILLVKELARKGCLTETVFNEMENIPRDFHTICHMNIWTGNLFLKAKPGSHSDHQVVMVDWTHCQLAPFTSDVIHLLFACCGSDIMTEWTEVLEDYYDYLKGYMSTHALDRNNTGLDYTSFWEAVAKTVRAEFLEEVVITPLTLLFGSTPKGDTLSPDDLTDVFESAEMIEEDVLPMMEMAMSLGLTKPVELLDPEMFREAGRRGSVLTGKLVTRKESLKEPLPACLRRKRSLVAPRVLRRPSTAGRDGAEEEASRNSSPGLLTPGSGGKLSRSSSFHRPTSRSLSRRSSETPGPSLPPALSRSSSRRGSEDPNSSDAMTALRAFQMRHSKQYRSQVPSSSETLGSALRMIKKRRSLFEHASVFGYGAW